MMTSQRWLIFFCAFSFPKRNLLEGRSSEGVRGGNLEKGEEIEDSASSPPPLLSDLAMLETRVSSAAF